jgi:hypothetical protein
MLIDVDTFSFSLLGLAPQGSILRGHCFFFRVGISTTVHAAVWFATHYHGDRSTLMSDGGDLLVQGMYEYLWGCDCHGDCSALMLDSGNLLVQGIYEY